MKTLTHVAARIVGSPLAIHPQKLEAILAAVGDRIGVGAWQDDSDYEPSAKKAYFVSDGVAVIPVQGTLMKKTYGLMAMSGCGSYETIGNALNLALADPQVKGIIFDIDSPGGETHGCFELCDQIYNARGKKPMIAAANDSAYSAAYAIASACDQVFVTRTGGVGSVGVLCMHVDESQADAKEGLKYTFIHFGDSKVEGNSHEPLSSAAKKSMQAEVDRQGEIFVNAVARNRGKKATAVKDTQANCFFAEQGVPLLADRVGTIDDAMAAMSAKIQSRGFSIITSGSLPSNGLFSLSDGVLTFTSTTPTISEPQIQQIEAPTDLPAMAGKSDKENPDMAKTETEAIVAVAAEEPMDDAQPKKAKAVKAKADPEDGETDDGDDDEDDAPKEKAKGKKAEASVDYKQVARICAIAGRPEFVSQAITEGLTVAQVEDHLMAVRAEASKQFKVSSGVNPNREHGKKIDAVGSQADELAATTGISRAQAYAKLLMQNPQAYTDFKRGFFASHKEAN